MLDETVAEWLKSLAERTPTPGGGAVAALSAALSAALVGMVTNYTTGPKWQDREAHMLELNQTAADLRQQALDLVEQDEAAFAQVGAAYKLPKNSDEEKAVRSQAIQAALKVACGPPEQIIAVAQQLVIIAEELVDNANPNVISDVAVAASNAKAALEGGIVNIEINEKHLNDAELKKHLQSVVSLATDSLKQAEQVVTAVRQRLGQ